MTEGDEETAERRRDRLRNLTTGALGAFGLIAWLAMLWFMFGDIL